jgi:tetratricopeptide (TPR) repeat protein
MAQGVRLLAAGELARAEAAFDQLIERDPKWAEARNKRATVYFLQGRDSASIADIFHTLELEPRHFGALGGFAQICMRNGAPDAARAALERLLAVNPGAPGIAEALAALERHHPKTIH